MDCLPIYFLSSFAAAVEFDALFAPRALFFPRLRGDSLRARHPHITRSPEIRRASGLKRVT